MRLKLCWIVRTEVLIHMRTVGQLAQSRDSHVYRH